MTARAKIFRLATDQTEDDYYDPEEESVREKVRSLDIGETSDYKTAIKEKTRKRFRPAGCSNGKVWDKINLFTPIKRQRVPKSLQQNSVFKMYSVGTGKVTFVIL